jgi:hypothetical protein
MFDPTAFDNMKTVLEGAVYDADLSGTLLIENRKDVIDLASLSREYEITFHLPLCEKVRATISLKATLAQLASELIPRLGLESGATVTVLFEGPSSFLSSKLSVIQSVWGEDGIYEIRQIISTSHPKTTEIIIHFPKPVQEEMMNELLVQVEMMKETLQKLAQES